MPSLLVTIFAVELAIRLIDTVGAATINGLLWNLLNYLPIETSKANSRQRQLQADYLKVRKELNGTSSQDEFAKWAKLRRNHDKLLEQLESNKKSMESTRSKFDSYLTGFRMLATRLPQYALPFWYGKVPMFWLPYGWFPYWAEWLLSFPRAPLGSVSIVSWQLACTGMIGLVSELIGAVIGLMSASKQQAQGQPMKVPASSEKTDKGEQATGPSSEAGKKQQ